MVFCVIRRKPYHLFWIGEEGMKASFDVTLSPKDLYRFNMYQTYTGFQVWSSIALGILGFVMALLLPLALAFAASQHTRISHHAMLDILFHKKQ